MKAISHSRLEESPEAKARWFQTLSVEERMSLLCEFTELALTLNPELPERRNDRPAQGRIRVITKA